MDKTFAWFIDIDVCNHLLQIGIEEYKAQFSLLNFPFSKFFICRKMKEVIVTLNSIFVGNIQFSYSACIEYLYLVGKLQNFILSGVYRIR